MSGTGSSIPALVEQAGAYWAEDTIGRWRLQMLEHGLAQRTGNLAASLHHEESMEGGDLHLTMSFLQYGMFADWGVGNGRKLRRGGRINPDRHPIPWFSSKWGIQRYILGEVIRKRLVAIASQLGTYADQRTETTQWTFTH